MARSVTPPLILIVDDDEGLRILMADAFRHEGCEVATVDSGGAALAWLETRTPALMLTVAAVVDTPNPLKRF